MLVFVLALTGCPARAERCAFCGMLIEPKSCWTAEIVQDNGEKLIFDSPRCALLSWRSGRVQAESLRVRDYYDCAWRDANDVLFVPSSDVLGPMGPDLVPVDRARAPQFAREHTGTRPLPLTDITLDLLKELN